MNNIPEDSMLRRHYLTELANKRASTTHDSNESFFSNQWLVILTAIVIFTVVLIV